jgi:hypothetical protein
MTYVLLVFFCLSAFAGSPSYLIKREENLLSFDFNKDKKVDYLEKFRGGKLIETQYDLDGDGKMDQLTVLDPNAEFFKIVEISRSKKSQKKRISYSNHELTKKTIVLTQIDRNNDGVWDDSYQTETSINQEHVNCSGPAISSQAETLAEDIQSAALQTDDYIQTNFGYRIHKSCSGPDKTWFVPTLRDSITTGLQCLTRLSQAGMRGAARNLSALESLLLTNNVQILCNENDYRWGRSVLAHATTGHEDAQRNLPLVHPGFSFNPLTILNDVFMTNPQNIVRIKRTAFHEQLHNLGTRHGVDPEISYTCGDCCFPPSDATEEATNAACNLCGGDYASITDPDYLRDITAFAQVRNSPSEARAAALAYLRENPTDNLGMAYLAVNSAGMSGPFGIELANILSAKTDLTPEAKALVERALVHNTSSELTPYRPGGRVIAESFIKLHQERNPRAALAHIRASEELLKAQFKLISGANAGGMLVNLRSNIASLTREVVWRSGPNGPPEDRDEALVTEAEAIYNLFGR